MESVKSGWRQHPASGKVVLGKLLHTMGKTTADRAAVNLNSQTHFSRLNSCVEAVLAGCRQQLGGDATGMIEHAVARHAMNLLQLLQYWCNSHVASRAHRQLLALMFLDNM